MFSFLPNHCLKKNIEIPNNFVWITDLAKFLSDLQINHDLSCFDSSLYTSFVNGNIPKDHSAELSIRKYLATQRNITLKQFSKDDVLYNRKPNSYFIASVRSNFLDDARPYDSFHFILVHQSMDKFTIICPRKVDFFYKTMNIDEFVRMINESGNWILRIQ